MNTYQITIKTGIYAGEIYFVSAMRPETAGKRALKFHRQTNSAGRVTGIEEIPGTIVP